MEFGVKIRDEADLQKISNLHRYKYIYFGNEFCERKIPSLSSIIKIFDFCESKDKIPVFLTPPLTNLGIRSMKNLLNELKKAQVFFEITINDFGLLNLLKDFSNIKINCGRILIKMKKGPEIVSGCLNEPPENFKDSGLSNNAFINFLLENNINRFETDISLQGINLPKERDISLYVGNSIVSLTRRCAYPGSDKDWYNYDIKPCNKECLNYLIVKKIKYYNQQVFVTGNAELIQTDFEINEQLKGFFNRVIIFPSIKDNL